MLLGKIESGRRVTFNFFHMQVENFCVSLLHWRRILDISRFVFGMTKSPYWYGSVYSGKFI